MSTAVTPRGSVLPRLCLMVTVHTNSVTSSA